MGKTARWLKALFGLKTSTKICGSGAGFVKPSATDKSPAAMRSINPQAKQAIAVAAATAAAADASVAAARAAAEVVRLNMNSKARNSFLARGGGRWAAVRIQTNFRGYLARKALRALKGVVKIQAIVRGYLVRKQLNATLHAVQAIFRLQSKRAINGLDRDLGRPRTLHWARSSMDGFGDAAETEQYYRSRWSAGKNRRLSLSSSEAKALNRPKVIEVDDGQTWSRVGLLTPEPDHSFSSSYHHRCLRPTKVRTNPSSIHEEREKEDQLYYYYYHRPTYMNKTMSFKAKTRAQSAPKQRPEAPINDAKRCSVSSGRKRMTLSGILMEATNTGKPFPI